MPRPLLKLLHLLVALSLLLGASATAVETPAVDVQRAGQQPRPAKARPAEPLSEEDAALVRELALIERVELLRNLELFEPLKRAQGRSKKGTP